MNKKIIFFLVLLLMVFGVVDETSVEAKVAKVFCLCDALNKVGFFGTQDFVYKAMVGADDELCNEKIFTDEQSIFELFKCIGHDCVLSYCTQYSCPKEVDFDSFVCKKALCALKSDTVIDEPDLNQCNVAAEDKEFCDEDIDCQSGKCHPTEKFCLVQDNGNCTLNEECKTGFCDPSSKLCLIGIGTTEMPPPTTPPTSTIPDASFPDASVLNQLSSTDVKTVIGNAIKTGMGVMGSIALAMFVYAGVIMMIGSTSVSGGATKHDILKAKAIMVWAVLGMFVIFASYAIVNFVFSTFQ